MYVCVCACVCVCMCVCVTVLLHDNSKSNQSRNMKLDYIVVYEISRTSLILGIDGPRSRSLHDFEIFLHLLQYKQWNNNNKLEGLY